ncbi:MAG: hypothetical protein PHN82_08665 [bacterium]|nr:hypothetical protein [bacterium]
MRGGGVSALTVMFLIATFALAVFDITEHDYWWHLATGKYIVEHRTIPREDVFSHTATRPWIAHYWLADVVGFLLHRVVGTPGLILANAALITLSFWIVMRTAAAGGGGTPAAVLVSMLAVYASRSRFYVRPETFSFLLTALYLALFRRWRREGRHRILLLFPPLQMLWTNLYGGGSIVGLVLLACFCGGEALNGLLRTAPEARRGAVRPLALAALLCLCAAFVNPNGHRTVAYFLMSRDPVFRHIVEWRRMGLGDLLGLHGLFLALAAAALLSGLRRIDWTDAALVAVFGAMSVDAPRSLPFFAIVSVPVIAPVVAARLGRPARGGWWPPLAAAAVGAFAVWFLFRDVGRFHRDYSFGLGVNMKIVPVQAVDFIERHGTGGPIFNSYGIGGYLIWRLFPAHRVFVDGRVEMYGTDFLDAYMRYWRPDVWEEYVRRYGITCAIIDREPTYTTAYLDGHPDWTLVFFDDRAMVYLRRVPENAATIRRFGYRHVRPAETRFDYLDRLLADPASAAAVIAELRRSLGNERYNLNARLMLGHCYGRLGGEFIPLALREYRAAARLMPEGRRIREEIRRLERWHNGGT